MSDKKKRKFGEGRSSTRFSFTYEDFADVFGCSVEAARKHAQRGNYNPSDLVSILEFVHQRLDKNGVEQSADGRLSNLLGEVRRAAGKQ